MTIKLTFRDFLKFIQIVLLITILGLLLWSKPWDTNKTQKTITVTGEATVEASPDEFTFNPYYEQSGTDREFIRTELVAQANEIVEEIKELGVAEEKITLDVSSYDRWYWEDSEEGTMNVYLQIKVTDKELAQTVQDYLLTTDARGQVTPQATFSKDRQKELEAEGVNKAIEDAKTKAETQARQLGVSVGEVVSFEEQQGFSGYFLESAPVSIESSDQRAQSLPILPGENELTNQVKVTFEIR
jgi:uncharacterized protein YggE